VLRDYLGGAGLGTWLLTELAPPGVDPMAPPAPLAFVFSPLVGTPLTTSAKFAVVAKSPLTGLLTDSLASSHFAIAGKLTGHDAIVLTGRASAPSVLAVDGGDVRLLPADDLWGLPAADAEQRLVDRLGAGWRVASIGPAGERGVRYATVSHAGRHAGRGGLGAVLGSKQVKAVAVHAHTKVAPARPDEVLAAAKDLRTRSLGRATEKVRELGTLANVLTYNALSTLPTRNFQDATFEGAPQLAAEELAEARSVTRASCASCSIGCEHVYRRKGGKKVRLEYQNVFALGPMCGVSDPDDVMAASARCDELGIDTISAGGTIAWAMECAERGLIDAPWLRFGDGSALLRALDEIGSGEGLGPLLAEGSRRAAALVGHGADALAVHVKGLELPGYEPRTLHAMALGLAVNARGADHNRSGAYAADFSGEHDRMTGGDAHVLAAVETEDRAAVMDSMILCSFLRGVFDDPFAEWAALLSPVTGWDVDADELRATARRIVLAKRAYNAREGWRREDDWLPPRLLEEPLDLPSGRTATLTAERLRAMLDGYIRRPRLDAQGAPARDVASGGDRSQTSYRLTQYASAVAAPARSRPASWSSSSAGCRAPPPPTCSSGSTTATTPPWCGSTPHRRRRDSGLSSPRRRQRLRLGPHRRGERPVGRVRDGRTAGRRGQPGELARGRCCPTELLARCCAAARHRQARRPARRRRAQHRRPRAEVRHGRHRAGRPGAAAAQRRGRGRPAPDAHQAARRRRAQQPPQVDRRGLRARRGEHGPAQPGRLVAAVAAGARAATDVTGFGLLGHLHKMMRASGTTAVVDAAAVPYLDGRREALRDGFVSGGTRRNLDWVRPSLSPRSTRTSCCCSPTRRPAAACWSSARCPATRSSARWSPGPARSSRSAERRPAPLGSAGLRGVLRLVLEVEVPVRRPDETTAPTRLPRNANDQLRSTSSQPRPGMPAKMAAGRKNMFATTWSKPMATNAMIGKTIARILLPTLSAAMAIQTARHTSQLAPSARRKIWYDDSSSAFFSAMPASRS
jgi:aldehyde:ferredoxin oxidoreductase